MNEFIPDLDLYQERILEHAKHPHHAGRLATYSVCLPVWNPRCGDRLTIYLFIRGERIIDVSFESEGCVISRAAASFLSDDIIGKTITEIMTYTREKMSALLGIAVNESRVSCLLLSLRATQQALSDRSIL